MIIDTITTGAGLAITLLDRSRHYFGGYYHVTVLAYCDIQLEECYFDDVADFNNAVAIMGNSVRFERVMEKMAVPESEIESVRCQLVNAFSQTTEKYLATPHFAHVFVKSEYQKRLNKSSCIYNFKST